MATAKQRATFLPALTQGYVEIAAPAKINLFLEVIRKRADGFHELETVMSTVDLFDRMRLTPRDDDLIRLRIVNPVRAAIQGSTDSTPGDSIPDDERNLAVRALLRLREFARQEELESTGSARLLGCDMVLWKRIPSAAGLGGASSNAAAALLAGCQMWQLQLTSDQLHGLAAELGSDVPFFLHRGAAVCRGRGELIEPLRGIQGLPIVIAKPVSGLSTPTVFSTVVPPTDVISAVPMIQSVVTNQRSQIAKLLFNRLQQYAAQLDPEIVRLSTAFRKINALGHQMSGSGSSYFGIFPSRRTARIAAQTLSARLPDVRIFVSQTSGIRLRIHPLSITA